MVKHPLNVSSALPPKITATKTPTTTPRRRPRSRAAELRPTALPPTATVDGCCGSTSKVAATTRIRVGACQRQEPPVCAAAITPALAAFFARRSPPAQSATSRVVSSGKVFRVACCAPRAVPVATVARSTYEAAGVDTGEAPEGPARLTGQVHTGGRVGGVGRPSDTRRDTWRTLGPGMQRAVCLALVNRGLEPVLHGLYGRPPPDEVHERIHDGDDDCPEGAAKASNDADIKPDWDAEGIIETFRTGQTAVAVVLSGTGMCKVPAPVRCSRKTSSCEFCDSAAGFSCVHAVRARSVRRGEPPSKVAAAGAGGATGDDGETAVDDAQSTLPLPLHNCLLSVRVDAKVCAYMREGKVLFVPAPLRCLTCETPRKKDTVKVDDGAVMCSEGYAAMGMESFFCSSDECQRWVFPEGRAEGLVILSCSTASTALIMRDMASEMVLSGSPFKACLKHWNNQFMDRRDSGAFPKMLPVKLKSRKTITSLFF